MNSVQGKIAIVTGAVGGIGEAAARLLAAGGAHVIVTGRDQTEGEAVTQSIRANGGSAEFATLDVTSERQWREVVGEVCGNHGGLDILFNNAGVDSFRFIAELSLEEFRAVIATNLEGTFLGTRAAIWGMTTGSVARPRGGSIINMASAAAHVCLPGQAAYAASKAAIKQLSRAVAVDCGRAGNGVRVNSVSPAMIDTPMLARGLPKLAAIGIGSTAEETMSLLIQAHPIGRIGTPEDVANVVCFLASDDSAFVTGTDILIDGGCTAI